MSKSWFLALAMVVGAILRTYNLEHFHALDSDEGVYAQAAFTLLSGQVPYRDFFFAGPPAYLYLSAVTTSISPSILAIRALNAVIGVLTIPALYYLSVQVYPSRRTATVAAWLLAVFPYSAYMNKLGIIENLLALLLVLGLLFFFKGWEAGSFQLLLFSGLLFGTALMTKYSAVWAILPLFAILVVRRHPRRVLPLAVGISLVPAAVTLTFAATGIFDAFYTETIAWQTIRLGQEPGERIWSFFLYMAAVFPLLLLGAIGLVKSRHEPNMPILGIVILVVLLGQLAGRTLFFHYYVMLTPLLCIFAARGIEVAASEGQNTLRAAFNRAERGQRRAAIRRIAYAVAGLLLLVPYAIVVGSMYRDPLPASGALFDDGTAGALAREKLEIARYIRTASEPRDRIWTSDAGLAFLSQRLIVPAEVDYWRFQGFFEDVWGYSGTTHYRGAIPGYPDGLVTLSQIRDSWRALQPKLIIMVRTSPVDDFVWNGIRNPDTNQTGLADYVLANYDLGPFIEGVGSTFYPSNTEIWVRR